MLNHKTVLEWSSANNNVLQYAIVKGKFYLLHITFQAININRLHFNTEVFKRSRLESTFLSLRFRAYFNHDWSAIIAHSCQLHFI